MTMRQAMTESKNDDNLKFNSYITVKNKYLGICFTTVHALQRFKEYSKESDKSDSYYIKQFKKSFFNAFDGTIKQSHKVFRLINNGYRESYYLFNHEDNFRFIVIKDTKDVVTCEQIHKKKLNFLP